MASDVVSRSQPAYDPGRFEAGWKDELWLTLVGSLDALLRSLYGIREFTDDPHCVLRIGISPARMPVTMSDGTRVRAGQLIGELHLWNEHIPRYSEHGPDLGWAADMRRRILLSLRLLAQHAERHPAWQQLPAFRADATLSSRLGDIQIRRLAVRHGFELVEPPLALFRQLHALGDSVSAWSLTRAFNPAALARQRFLRDHHELWISRATLLKRYAREARKAPGAKPHRAA
jgi:hypothetical protein